MRTLIPKASEVAWTDDTDAFNAVPIFGEGDTSEAPVAAGASQPVSANPGQQLAANKCRTCLIIQNNSATGGPVLWFAFGQPAIVNQCFALQPGGSLVIAEPTSCPKESVYITWAGAGTQIAAMYENSAPCPQPTPAVANMEVLAWGIPATSPSPPPVAVAPPAPPPTGIILAARYIP